MPREYQSRSTQSQQADRVVVGTFSCPSPFWPTTDFEMGKSKEDSHQTIYPDTILQQLSLNIRSGNRFLNLLSRF